MEMRKRALYVILVLAALSIPAFAKSFSYDYINLRLNFSADGSVTISQLRAYNFQGSFSYAYLDLLKKGAEDVKFLEVRDLDENVPLALSIDENSEHVKATWYYRANDETKRFLITYRIDGAVKRYLDVADFYWKVIEDSHERAAMFNAEIILPARSPNLFKVFVHSSAYPDGLNFSDDLSRAYVMLYGVPKDAFVEFRVLTDPAAFPGVTQVPEERYEAILGEESAIAYAPLLVLIALPILLLVVPMALFFYFYLKYGREPKVEYDAIYEHEPPSDIPPMALSNLMEGEEEAADISQEARGMLATIFDLARRGYLEVREREKKQLLGLIKGKEQVFTLTEKGKREAGSLEGFESRALAFLMACSKKEGEVTGSDITAYCQAHQSSVQAEIISIDLEARRWFENKYFPITEAVSRRERSVFTAILTAYFIVLAAYVLLVIARTPLMGSLGMMAVGGVLGYLVAQALSMPISRRTPESALEVRRWKAFKKFITDFSAMKDAPSTLLHIWDKYLVYAIALGVAEKLLKNIEKLSVQTNTPLTGVAWYYGAGATPSATVSTQSISAFTSSLSGTISSLSSSTSVGGGFSGGGGGGGGGGSSGAG